MIFYLIDRAQRQESIEIKDLYNTVIERELLEQFSEIAMRFIQFEEEELMIPGTDMDKFQQKEKYLLASPAR